MRKTLLHEIGLLVIDELGAEEDWKTERKDAHHIRTLANCALACKAWLYRARINLYRTIYVDDYPSLQSLYDTLIVHPSLRALVQTVKAKVGIRQEVMFPDRSVLLHDVLLFVRKMVGPVLCHLVIVGLQDIPLTNLARNCLYPLCHISNSQKV